MSSLSIIIHTKYKNESLLCKNMQLQKHISIASHSRYTRFKVMCDWYREVTGCTDIMYPQSQMTLSFDTSSPSESHEDDRKHVGIDDLIREI